MSSSKLCRVLLTSFHGTWLECLMNEKWRFVNSMSNSHPILWKYAVQICDVLVFICLCLLTSISSLLSLLCLPSLPFLPPFFLLLPTFLSFPCTPSSSPLYLSSPPPFLPLYSFPLSTLSSSSPPVFAWRTRSDRCWWLEEEHRVCRLHSVRQHNCVVLEGEYFS